MPRDAADVASDLRTKLENHDNIVFTMAWGEVYALCDRVKWTRTAYEELTEAATAESLVVGYGNNVIVVSEDSDFAPIG